MGEKKINDINYLKEDLELLLGKYTNLFLKAREELASHNQIWEHYRIYSQVANINAIKCQTIEEAIKELENFEDDK